MDWPRIRPRDGTDLWSDASNLSGDKVGKDYEQLVRGKLLGESGQQDDRDIEVSAYLQEQECRLLMNLWREAFRASQESWETNHEPQYRFNRPITTKTDVRLTRRINIPERLGIGAEVLCGNPRLPARTIVETSVNGARFFMKCFQLDKFLMLATPEAVPAAALVINKKPIDCCGMWSRAIQKFPHLHELHQQGRFCVVYWPHSLSIAQVQALVERAVMQERDRLAAAHEPHLQDRDQSEDGGVRHRTSTAIRLRSRSRQQRSQQRDSRSRQSSHRGRSSRVPRSKRRASR